MPSSYVEALERLYAAAVIDDRTIVDPLLASGMRDDAEAPQEVCTGFAGTVRFLRFVSGRFASHITLDRISECGSGIEVRGRLRMRSTSDGLDLEFPFIHQHAYRAGEGGLSEMRTR